MKKKQVKQITTQLNSLISTLNAKKDEYESLINRIENDTNEDGTKGLWSGNLAATWVLNAKKDCAIIAELTRALNTCAITADVIADNAKKVDKG